MHNLRLQEIASLFCPAKMATQKTFVPLENNPSVMTKLAHRLGLSENLEFLDVYSLTDHDLIAFLQIPA